MNYDQKWSPDRVEDAIRFHHRRGVIETFWPAFLLGCMVGGFLFWIYTIAMTVNA